MLKKFAQFCTNIPTYIGIVSLLSTVFVILVGNVLLWFVPVVWWLGPVVNVITLAVVLPAWGQFYLDKHE